MRLDTYIKFPSGMMEYLGLYGWHFSKKMCDWAVGMMKKENDKSIDKITKEDFEKMAKRYDVKLDDICGYDALYIANMCKADYYEKSVPDEHHMVKYVENTLKDPDGYDGIALTRFFADCIGKGIPIHWEDMI